MFGSFLQVPGLGVSSLEIKIESRVGWRPDSKEIVLEVVADKTKVYGHVSRSEYKSKSPHKN
jgi:hypothetical protein